MFEGNEIVYERLFSLIDAGESETIEFKESFGDEALETIGAFSNARGGTLLIGVKDSGDISGSKIGKKTLEDIANRIQEVTDPRLQPSISFISHEKENVIIILIAAATGVPVSVRGRYFRRTGRSNQRMSHEEIMQRMLTSTGLSWDAIIENGSSLEDLNSEHINRFVSTIKKQGRLPISTQSTDREVLKKLELIKNEKPTRAALLLFGEKTQSYFPSAFLKIGRFRSPTHILDDREIHGTLIDQLDGAMGWFRERLETEFIITGRPEREVHWEYPLEAIREAVTNILCHRDYNSLAHSQIRLYDSHLEMWNAGCLPPALTPEALLHEHDSMPRNRKIAESFFYAGFIERWGSGTLRMAEKLKAAGFPPPQFESQSGRFRVDFCKQSQPERVPHEVKLTERQVKALAYVRKHGSISNAEYQAVAGVSKRTASRELNELKEKGILISAGNMGRSAIYELRGS